MRLKELSRVLSWMKRMKRTEKLAFTVWIMGMSLLATLLVGAFRFSTNGYQIVTAHGTSMYPTIKNGDRCIINNNIPEGNLTGLIMVFGAKRICHRCLLDEGEWLTFRGDNCTSEEHATRDELKAVFIKVTYSEIPDMIGLGLSW